MRAVQPLICGSGELRSEPLHSSIFLILLMSFELVAGAAHAPADSLSKSKTAAPTKTNRSGRSGEICVSIAHTRKNFAPKGRVSSLDRSEDWACRALARQERHPALLRR